ncbi:MAG: phosphatase PAP2 family protein [Candidatus Thiodiazotropha sp.]|jgi:undecaprenyl-diphosphatase
MTPDELILHWIHVGLSCQLSDSLFHWFSSRATFSLPILFALLFVAVRREGWQGAGWWFTLILVVGIGDQFGNLLKSLFSELRPCALEENITLTRKGLSCDSVPKGMPSNHALNFYAATLFVVLTRTKWHGWHALLLMAALLASLSRIYLVKHYPSQVVAGIFLGINIGVVAALLYQAPRWFGQLRTGLSRLAHLQTWQNQIAENVVSRK